MKTVAIPVTEDIGLESTVAKDCANARFYLFLQIEDKHVKHVETQKAPEKACGKWNCRTSELLQTQHCDVILIPQLGKAGWKYCKAGNVEIAIAGGTKAKDVLNAYLGGHYEASHLYESCPFSAEGMFTAAAHAGGMDKLTGSVTIPIYQTSTFAFENAVQGANRFAGKEDGYIYTRLGNPTIRALEDTVACLEGGFRGLATSTGMSAVVTVYMAFLGKDLHIVGTDSLYGPSRVVVERDLSRFGVKCSFVDTSNLDEIKKAMRPETRILYIETPANPTIKLTDIEACSKIAHDNGALLVVDNTFMSPYLQRPFELGADIVLHSMTKFLNGHSDVVAGMLVAKTQELFTPLYKTLTYFGGTMDPHQAYLVIRGIKTLPLRMEKSQETAAKLAQYLENHPKIIGVKYPGLKSHPQYELAKKQMRGAGALISFEVKGGIEAGRKLMDGLHVPTLAVSLGGVESLIQHPASMTHAGMAKENREKAGITDGLIRFSVGCEDYADLRDDLEHALENM